MLTRFGIKLLKNAVAKVAYQGLDLSRVRPFVVRHFVRVPYRVVPPGGSEGMSGAVLEAMGARLPVVATNVGSNSELVSEGETGFLVEPRDETTMAERLARLMANRELARQLGEAGRRRLEQSYGIETMVQRYEELYLSLARRSSKGNDSANYEGLHKDG